MKAESPHKLLGQYEVHKYLSHKALDNLFVSRPEAYGLHKNFT